MYNKISLGFDLSFNFSIDISNTSCELLKTQIVKPKYCNCVYVGTFFS